MCSTSVAAGALALAAREHRTTVISVGALGTQPARRTTAYALLAGLAALVVDVHLY
ncbi:hypothetical protein [Streptomyces sp. CB01881]|uniref:hypothetical protein n=1 Tax=Streptomyces sp. CB01881 TaxID=2078691 RepID=UPI00129C1231|nr:hypothetical protein [Streptomyces sp. CB01881]